MFEFKPFQVGLNLFNESEIELVYLPSTPRKKDFRRSHQINGQAVNRWCLSLGLRLRLHLSLHVNALQIGTTPFSHNPPFGCRGDGSGDGSAANLLMRSYRN
jgi:hypothetical protein